MAAYSDLSVWIDVSNREGQTVLVPYVSSPRDGQLRYALKLIDSGKAGTSRVSQSGTVSLHAQRAQPVSTLKVTRDADRRCTLEVTLFDGAAEVGHYTLDCSAKG